MKKRSHFRLCIALILTAVLSTQKAWAVDRLTEENIRELYSQLALVMKEKNKDNIFSFLNTRFHEDFILTFNYPVAGKDGLLSEKIQTKTNKEQLIQNIKDVPSESYSFENHEVFFILISDDGRTAQAKDRGKASYGENGFFVVDVECDDQVILSNEGTIQFTKSTCSWLVPEQLKQKPPQ